jgi:precorrin-3B synthase
LPETPRTFAVHLCGDDANAAICAEKDAPVVAAQLARAFLAFSLPDPQDAPRRMRMLVAAVGAPAIFVLAGLEAKPRPRSPKRMLLEDALGVHEYSGAVVVGAAAPFGHIQADNFKVLITQARGAGAANVRLAPWRTIFVTGLDRAAAASFSAACEDLGFITDASEARLRIAACSGAPGCIHANRPVQEDAARWAHKLPKGDGVLFHVSGCKKGCAHSRSTAATLVATESGYDLIVNGTPSDAPTIRGLSVDAAEAWLASEGARLFASEAPT